MDFKTEYDLESTKYRKLKRELLKLKRESKKLNEELMKKEQALYETHMLKYKIWFLMRLLWTYIKSMFLSFFLVSIVWIAILGVDENRFFNPIFFYSYLVAIFVVLPFFFIIRRVHIILKEDELLDSETSVLKEQLKGKEAIIAEMTRKLEETKQRIEKIRRELEEKGFARFVDRAGKERWGTTEQVEEWKRIDIGLNNHFAHYSPREFEVFIAKLFQKMGYKVTLGPYVSDYGVDVIAEKDNRRILIQVKKYSPENLVGNRVVRETLGAIWNRADKAIIITTSDFTEQAYEQARGAPVELWNYHTLKKYVEKYFIKETSVSLNEKRKRRTKTKVKMKKESTSKHISSRTRKK